MRRHIMLAALVMLAIAGRAHAEEVYQGIDLASFSELEALPEVEPTPYCDPMSCVERPTRRFYVTGLLGASFANLTAPGNSQSGLDTEDTLFAAGFAAGLSLERQRGRLRVEVEGMGRDVYEAAYPGVPNFGVILTNSWSATANLWRDFMFTDRFGIYGGGGLGAGGYQLGERDVLLGTTQYYDPTAAFAWQLGAGLVYELSDRLTLDVGYRYLELDSIQQSQDVLPNKFATSEVMVSLRFYEPFRSWRR